MKSEKLIETIDTLGTLLYGLAVDSKGNAFIAQRMRATMPTAVRVQRSTASRS